jgi:hypothetical protein
MKLLSALLLSAMAVFASASEQSACAAAKGKYMVGTVVSDPSFAYGSYRQDVELSHTHIQLRNDADGRNYDIAIDNIYANGYDDAGESVPDPLTNLVYGTRVEICGQSFPGGMHWVHSNCGVRPSSSQPDGWVKIIDDSGVPGDSLTDNQEYCYLFN